MTIFYDLAEVDLVAGTVVEREYTPTSPHRSGYYPGNKEGHIPTRSASEGPMKSSESRRGSPLDD